MIVKQLRLTNVRVFREAEFSFQPGMNLLVGVNGVGKSTVLDVLRRLFSGILQDIPHYDKQLKFDLGDLKIGTDCLSSELSFKIGRTEQHKFLIKKYKENYPFKTALDKAEAEAFADGLHIESIANDKFIPLQEHNPLCVYFSPYRSILDASKSRLKKNISPAHFKALEPRQLKLQEFIDWWLGRKKLAQEGLASGQIILNALEQAVIEFLGCSNLHVDEKKKTLLIEKSGVTLDVKQLSDGERGILALVLDLTKRLAEANPYVENPAKEGKAVVLIDELDLHLHPKWQRTIVDQLTRTFPNCQFIATTHSPQIISQVQPKSITFLVREGDQVVVRPARQAYGLDTNWILESLMGVDSRPKPTQELIDQIENLLQEGELELAREILKKLRKMLHGDDGEVIRLEASIDTLEALREDEVDSEKE